MQYAAHQLDKDAKQWESKDNAMVEAARKMAKLMMQMAKYARWDKTERTCAIFFSVCENEQVDSNCIINLSVIILIVLWVY